MKKTIAMLLVAMLTVGSVFAAFSGKASLGVGVDLDDKEYGILDQSTSFTMGFELATAEGENVGEGDVYASIKGSMVLEVFKAPDATSGLQPNVNKWDGKHYVGLGLSMDEAKVAGSNWYVSILGMPDAPDFAKSAIDTYKTAKKSYDVVVDSDGTTKNASTAFGYYKDAADNVYGVEVGIAGYVFGGGLWGTYGDNSTFQANGYIMTPEYDFDGLTLQVGGAAAVKKSSASIKGDVSAKVGYATDVLSACIASDVILGIPTNDGDFTIDADVAADFTYDFIDIDFFYGTNPVTKADSSTTKNLLSAKAAFDLNSFEVPVAVTLTGKDLINKQDLDASVEFAIGDVTLTPCVGYVIKDEKFNAGIAAEYTHEYFTLSAETNITTAFKDNDLVWDAAISLENDTLIPGATLSLAWADADDILKNDAKAKTKLGSITASISMSF